MTTAVVGVTAVAAANLGVAKMTPSMLGLQRAVLFSKLVAAPAGPVMRASASKLGWAAGRIGLSRWLGITHDDDEADDEADDGDELIGRFPPMPARPRGETGASASRRLQLIVANGSARDNATSSEPAPLPAWSSTEEQLAWTALQEVLVDFGVVLGAAVCLHLLLFTSWPRCCNRKYYRRKQLRPVARGSRSRVAPHDSEEWSEAQTRGSVDGGETERLSADASRRPRRNSLQATRRATAFASSKRVMRERIRASSHSGAIPAPPQKPPFFVALPGDCLLEATSHSPADCLRIDDLPIDDLPSAF